MPAMKPEPSLQGPTPGESKTPQPRSDPPQSNKPDTEALEAASTIGLMMSSPSPQSKADQVSPSPAPPSAPSGAATSSHSDDTPTVQSPATSKNDPVTPAKMLEYDYDPSEDDSGHDSDSLSSSECGRDRVDGLPKESVPDPVKSFPSLSETHSEAKSGGSQSLVGGLTGLTARHQKDRGPGCEDGIASAAANNDSKTSRGFGPKGAGGHQAGGNVHISSKSRPASPQGFRPVEIGKNILSARSSENQQHSGLIQKPHASALVESRSHEEVATPKEDTRGSTADVQYVKELSRPEVCGATDQTKNTSHGNDSPHRATQDQGYASVSATQGRQARAEEAGRHSNSGNAAVSNITATHYQEERDPWILARHESSIGSLLSMVLSMDSEIKNLAGQLNSVRMQMASAPAKQPYVVNVCRGGTVNLGDAKLSPAAEAALFGRTAEKEVIAVNIENEQGGYTGDRSAVHIEYGNQNNGNGAVHPGAVQETPLIYPAHSQSMPSQHRQEVHQPAPYASSLALSQQRRGGGMDRVSRVRNPGTQYTYGNPTRRDEGHNASREVSILDFQKETWYKKPLSRSEPKNFTTIFMRRGPTEPGRASTQCPSMSPTPKPVGSQCVQSGWSDIVPQELNFDKDNQHEARWRNPEERAVIRSQASPSQTFQDRVDPRCRVVSHPTMSQGQLEGADRGQNIIGRALLPYERQEGSSQPFQPPRYSCGVASSGMCTQDLKSPCSTPMYLTSARSSVSHGRPIPWRYQKTCSEGALPHSLPISQSRNHVEKSESTASVSDTANENGGRAPNQRGVPQSANAVRKPSGRKRRFPNDNGQYDIGEMYDGDVVPRRKRFRNNWTVEENNIFFTIVTENMHLPDSKLLRLISNRLSSSRTYQQVKGHLKNMRASGRLPPSMYDVERFA